MLESAAAAGLRGLEVALALPPERVALAWGRALGAATGGARIRRATVEQQIARAFPAHDPEWVRGVARRCYRHYGEELVRTVRLAQAGPAALVERVVNPEAVRRYAEIVPPGSGAIVVTGHLGNWELGGAYLAASGLRVTAVVRRQSAGVERRLRELRTALRIESVAVSDAPQRLGRALGEGRTVALVADQHAPAARGVQVPFLGRPAWTHRGPARLALACKVPLLFGALVRDGARYRSVLQPVELPPPGRNAELELTRAWVARLEEAVRAAPEQYFWFHRRWKEGRATGPAGGGGLRTGSGDATAAGSGPDGASSPPQATGAPERAAAGRRSSTRRPATS